AIHPATIATSPAVVNTTGDLACSSRAPPIVSPAPTPASSPVDDQVKASVECSGRECPATSIDCIISAGAIAIPATRHQRPNPQGADSNARGATPNPISP